MMNGDFDVACKEDLEGFDCVNCLSHKMLNSDITHTDSSQKDNTSDLQTYNHQSISWSHQNAFVFPPLNILYILQYIVVVFFRTRMGEKNVIHSAWLTKSVLYL